MQDENSMLYGSDNNIVAAQQNDEDDSDDVVIVSSTTRPNNINISSVSGSPKIQSAKSTSSSFSEHTEHSQPSQYSEDVRRVQAAAAKMQKISGESLRQSSLRQSSERLYCPSSPSPSSSGSPCVLLKSRRTCASPPARQTLPGSHNRKEGRCERQCTISGFDSDDDSEDNNCDDAISQFGSCSQHSNQSIDDISLGNTRSRAPGEYIKPNTITDAQRFPFPFTRYWHPDKLMVPPVEQFRMMNSQSKSFSMEPPQDNPEYAGASISFVDLCNTGLTDELMNVIYFFEKVQSISQHFPWTGFTVPTGNLKDNLHLSFSQTGGHKKDVTGVLCGRFSEGNESHSLRGDGGIDLSRVLASSDSNASGTAYTSLPLISISVGFTAAVYKTGQARGAGERAAGREINSTRAGVRQHHGNEETDSQHYSQGSGSHFSTSSFAASASNSDIDECYCGFGVVTVTSLLNVDLMKLLLDCFFRPPAANLANFEKHNNRQREMIQLLERILIYQSSGVMGDRSGLRPLDFFRKPNGQIGINTICSPFLEPLKMVQLIKTRVNKSANNIQIIGYPKINWQGDPDAPGDLKNYLSYNSGSRAHLVFAESLLTNAIADYCKDDKKSKGRRKRGQGEDANEDESVEKEYNLAYHYYWPTKRTDRWYTEFLRTLCPIHLKLRRLRETNIDDQFDTWSINLGTLPPLAVCLLRSCLLHDPENIEARSLNDILLRDKQPWNLALIYQQFYKSGAGCKDQVIAKPGCNLGTYLEILRYVNENVKTGCMTSDSALRLLHKSIEYSISLFGSMVEANAFLSKRVTQAWNVMKAISRDEQEKGLSVYHDLREYRKILMQSTGTYTTFNPYDRARRFVFEMLCHVNRYWHLNSGNVQLFLELMISMICHTFGFNNETIQPFGRGIELAPCCGTLDELISDFNKSVRVRLMSSDNSAGKDFTAKKVGDVFAAFLEDLGVSEESFQGMVVLTRFTPVAIESMTTVSWRDDEVIDVPDSNLNGRFYTFTEVRGSNIYEVCNTLITGIYTRGENQPQKALTTMERSNKTRHSVNKEQVSRLALCLRCSNEHLEPKLKEPIDTILAVNHCMEPGSAPFSPSSVEGEFNEIDSNPFESRSTPLDGEARRYAPLGIACTHLICTTFLGLINLTGGYRCEINSVSIALLDWVFFYIQKHLDSLLHPKCQGKNMLRFQRIYEARAAAFTAWCKTIQALTEHPDRNKAVRAAIASYQCDAIALTDIGGLVWSMIRRCLHWGPVLYACCYMKEVKMPIVAIDTLVQLLKMENPPQQSETLLFKGYQQICSWLQDCLVQHRFCPSDLFAPSHDFTPYLSSSGLSDGSVESGGVLRVNMSTNGWREAADKHVVESVLAEETVRVYGEELKHSCSVSKSSLICALQDSMNGFALHIQKLLGINFDLKRHVSFFKLEGHIGFSTTADLDARNPFMIRSAWVKDAKETASVGVGIHFVQLLLLGSLIGDFAVNKLHPKILSDLSRGLLRQILLNAPPGVTPGNSIDIRSFNCFTGRPECVRFGDRQGAQSFGQGAQVGRLKEVRRPEHFLRPCDSTFARTGDLSSCRNIQNFAPEDVLHMGALCEYAQRIGCKIHEVPPRAHVTYYLCPKRNYCVYNRALGVLGIIMFDGERVMMEMEVQHGGDQRRSCNFSITDWHLELAESGFIVMPMIWRSGACVRVEVDGIFRVGCLAPPADPSSEGNFSLENLGYEAVVLGDFPRKINALDVCEALLPIGTRLYICAESSSAVPLLRRLNVNIPDGEMAGYAIQAHLNSPSTRTPEPGRVNMTFVVQSPQGALAESVVVDPWELLLESGERHVFTSVSAV